MEESGRPPLLAVVGATAVGKTGAAIRLARDLGGEVVSADSRYLYRGMDIGTATPSEAEMAGVPHHLISFLEPDEPYSLALYQRDAYRAIDAVMARGRVPILAGGTPLYVRAVLEGWRIPEVPPDPALRAALEERAQVEGPGALHRELSRVDAAAAARIPASNVRRVIRALEIYQQSGRPMTELEGRAPPPYRTLLLGLRLPREELYRRIDGRVEEQLAGGLVDEVRRLLEQGISPVAPAMSSIGYPEIVAYLEGRLSLPEAAAAIRHHTHRYARHQLTWLRRMAGVRWFEASEPDWYARMLAEAKAFVHDETAPREVT